MSMENRIVVVTGANSGIGLECARGLARLGATIVLVCRDPARGAAALDEVRKVASSAAPALEIADLSSQSAVRALARKLRAELPRIDVLVNNAGAAFRHRQLTADSVERTLAVNHLAPFLLTHLVMDLLRAAPAARIIATASDIHAGKVDLDDLQLKKKYSWVRAYALSKLGNVLFTKELARRFAGTPMTAYCFEPGPALSNFGHGAGGTLGLASRLLHLLSWTPLIGSTEDGARTAIHLATSDDVTSHSGGYFRKCREVKSKPITQDESIAQLMWAASARLCGLAEDALARDRLVRTA